jgi:hypothetical protein
LPDLRIAPSSVQLSPDSDKKTIPIADINFIRFIHFPFLNANKT